LTQSDARKVQSNSSDRSGIHRRMHLKRQPLSYVGSKAQIDAPKMV